MLYVSFWVIPWRLIFICRRFGTLCLFWGITQKETYKSDTPIHLMFRLKMQAAILQLLAASSWNGAQ
jgi:hypothetical protein